MVDSPEAVLLYIPLMKELGMSWEEIKSTPRMELEGLLAANQEHNLLHAMDGYEAKDINDMALAGHDIMSILESNTYSGLEAQVQFNNWKRV